MACSCDRVRSSCQAFVSEIACVDEIAIQRFADSINIQDIKRFCFSGDGLSTNRFPEIEFQSTDDEAGFIFIAHAIDFGSGFRPQLHQSRNGQGAWLTIRAGLVNMGKICSNSNANWLSSLTLEDIKSMFDLTTIHLELLAQYLLDDLHEIGNVLTSLNYSTPGAFIMENVSIGASALVGRFVELFPLCFRDQYTIREQEIYFYKKAQLVVSELYMRFAPENEMFNFPDIDKLTAFVDNVVVAMMRMTGLTITTPRLTDAISAGAPILKGSEEEVALRSASLTAVSSIVSHLSQRKVI